MPERLNWRPFKELKQPAKTQINQEIIHWEGARKELLKHYNRVPENLNIGGIADFFSAKGLNTAQVIFVDDEHGFEKLHEVYGRIGQPAAAQFASGRWEAFYDAELDLIVMRWPNYGEKPQGAAAIETECLLAHEAAHSTSNYPDCIIYENTIEVARMGFLVGHRNKKNKNVSHFLEEGFAEMLVGEYRARRLDEENKRQFLPHQQGNRVNMEQLINYDHDGNTPSLPAKYVPSTHRADSFLFSGYAGYALELMCRKKPELLAAIIASRTNPKGLRQATAIIDSIQHGLYTKLRHLKYKPNHFIRGLKMVQDALEVK